jgi:peptidoglycan/LPS O-acetylase OafA/YrhL
VQSDRVVDARPATASNISVNVLRTVAAVLVVLSHARALFFRDFADVPHTPVTSAFYVVTGLGHQAVMVFFVLSGFWVGGSVIGAVRQGTFGWADYAIRRLSRLWVVVLPGILLTAGCAFATLHFFGNSDVAQGDPGYHDVAAADLESRLGPVAALGNAFFLQGIHVPTYGSNGPLWSLSYEFWYYAMFPLLVLALLASRSWVRVLSVLLLAGCAALVGWDVMAYFPVWLLGAAVAMAQPRLRSLTERMSSKGLRVLRSGALLALVASMAMAAVGALGNAGDAVVAIATAVLLVALLGDVRPRGVRGKMFRAVGRYADASFSLYVIHLPLLVLLAAAVLPRVVDRWAPDPASYLLFAAMAAGTLAVGWLFARVTEFHTGSIRRWAAARLGVRRPGASRPVDAPPAGVDPHGMPVAGHDPSITHLPTRHIRPGSGPGTPRPQGGGLSSRSDERVAISRGADGS